MDMPCPASEAAVQCASVALQLRRPWHVLRCGTLAAGFTKASSDSNLLHNFPLLHKSLKTPGIFLCTSVPLAEEWEMPSPKPRITLS